MILNNETIAAIATGLTDSGISIIRVSGKEAISIVDKIFKIPSGKKLEESESHKIHYGFIYENDDVVDEVMVSIFRAPRSYTAEDVVEINCHGGILITRKVLNLVLDSGARIAEPGEFTKRAFLNGRIDLSKAEAVMDMIHAKNEFALKSSVKQIRGSLSRVIKELREEIIYQIAFIESALDDPEHISLDGYYEDLSKKNDSLIHKIQRLYDNSENGKILKEGINTVIVGKPNAGKSSLLNILVGEEKAIVTDIAGTTRDVIEEHIRLSGFGLNMIDTAGIRRTDDTVEKIGVEKAKMAAKDADLIIYVVDSSTYLDKNDIEIMRIIRDKKVIVLLNKSDLPSVVDEKKLLKYLHGSVLKLNNDIYDNFDEEIYDINFSEIKDNIKIIKTSTKEHLGIEDIENAIKEMFFNGMIQMNDEVMITNLRQKESLKDALDSLVMVRNSIRDNMPEDFISIDLMGAYSSLGNIIGEEVGEDLINEIFSKFCMGK